MKKSLFLIVTMAVVLNITACGNNSTNGSQLDGRYEGSVSDDYNDYQVFLEVSGNDAILWCDRSVEYFQIDANRNYLYLDDLHNPLKPEEPTEETIYEYKIINDMIVIKPPKNSDKWSDITAIPLERVEKGTYLPLGGTYELHTSNDDLTLVIENDNALMTSGGTSAIGKVDQKQKVFCFDTGSSQLLFNYYTINKSIVVLIKDTDFGYLLHQTNSD